MRITYTKSSDALGMVGMGNGKRTKYENDRKVTNTDINGEPIEREKIALNGCI